MRSFFSVVHTGKTKNTITSSHVRICDYCFTMHILWEYVISHWKEDEEEEEEKVNRY